MVRGRLRLGLAVGVRSLARPALPICSSAFERVAESTGSEFRSWMLTDWLRLWVAVGGVFDSGGEIRVGVAIPSSASAAAVALSPSSTRTMAVGLICYDGRIRAVAVVESVRRFVAKSVTVNAECREGCRCLYRQQAAALEYQ